METHFLSLSKHPQTLTDSDLRGLRLSPPESRDTASTSSLPLNCPARCREKTLRIAETEAQEGRLALPKVTEPLAPQLETQLLLARSADQGKGPCLEAPPARYGPEARSDMTRLD